MGPGRSSGVEQFVQGGYFPPGTLEVAVRHQAAQGQGQTGQLPAVFKGHDAAAHVHHLVHGQGQVPGVFAHGHQIMGFVGNGGDQGPKAKTESGHQAQPH